MHSEPVATIDQRVASHKLWRKRLIIVWLIAEIEFGYTSLGHDTAVVGLSWYQSRAAGSLLISAMVMPGVPHVHDIVVSLFSLRPPIARLFCNSTRRSARRLGLRLGVCRHGREAE
jgi:hypothetical protein